MSFAPTQAQAFRLSDAERLERYRLLLEATALREPPVITEAGLQLLLRSATSPQRPEFLDEAALPERDRLVQAGLIGTDGRLNPVARDVVDTVFRPDVQLEIEVVARQSVRAWKAWLGYRRAVILAQDSPAITASDGPRDIAGRTPPTLPGYHLEVAVPGWAPIAAARWLGLGPRDSPAGSCRLPWSALLQRVADPRAPLPGDDPLLARIWDQPMQLCALTVQPRDDQTLWLDAARAGLWLLTTEPTIAEPTGTEPTPVEPTGTVVLTPLPSHTAWRLLLTLITRNGQARQPALI